MEIGELKEQVQLLVDDAADAREQHAFLKRLSPLTPNPVRPWLVRWLLGATECSSTASIFGAVCASERCQDRSAAMRQGLSPELCARLAGTNAQLQEDANEVGKKALAVHEMQEQVEVTVQEVQSAQGGLCSWRTGCWMR
jgi:hypothetical protein